MKTSTDRLAAKQGGALDLSGLGDLALMLQAPAGQGDVAGPQLFDLDCIHEDEGNSRTEINPGFSQESINELAESMGEGRGVKSPLSLRPDPQRPGHYIINHGHRRYRAAKVAGLTQVPAFIDESFDKFDQVIENIHREALTSREIADFIGSAMAEGYSMTDIARLLGKSKAYVSQHAVLLDLPEPVAQAFHAGRVKDVTLVNELVRAHKESPQAVEQALAPAEPELAAKPLNREVVKAIRKTKAGQGEGAGSGAEVSEQMAVLVKKLRQHLQVPVRLERAGRSKALQLVFDVQDEEAVNDLIGRLGLAELDGPAV